MYLCSCNRKISITSSLVIIIVIETIKILNLHELLTVHIVIHISKHEDRRIKEFLFPIYVVRESNETHFFYSSSCYIYTLLYKRLLNKFIFSMHNMNVYYNITYHKIHTLQSALY